MLPSFQILPLVVNCTSSMKASSSSQKTSMSINSADSITPPSAPAPHRLILCLSHQFILWFPSLQPFISHSGTIFLIYASAIFPFPASVCIYFYPSTTTETFSPPAIQVLIKHLCHLSHLHLLSLGMAPNLFIS